jgi:putative DNA methylase
MRLLEVRGPLPPTVVCPTTGVTIDTKEGTVPRKAHFSCAKCGTVQGSLEAVKSSGKSGPIAAYVVQGYSPKREREGESYGGRFFAPVQDSAVIDAAQREWEIRKETDLAAYWPRSELPYGFMTHTLNGGIPNHGYTHWSTFFNPRQLLLHALLLKAIDQVGGERHRWAAREYVLAAFQPYLRNQCMLAFWHRSHDHFTPALSNNNFHPKDTSIEVGAFSPIGYGPWPSTTKALVETLNWSGNPWELVSNEALLRQLDAATAKDLTGKSEKVSPKDPVQPGVELGCGSSTDLAALETASYDLVITDPPFGGLLHYSELSDFFYVWLRLLLKKHYPDYFTAEYTPKTLEAVSNRARQPENPDAYYEKLLTLAWEQAHRILKPGGILAFTFHHSEDSPWVSVLESLFKANFYLEATYPIRSDETKGEGSKPGTFGSQQIEFDIIHVCRKRRGQPETVSDQIQKFLRGTGIAPSDFEARGWCSEDKKIYHLTSPLEVARAWQGKHRRGMTSDYDQAAFLIGACFENSGINATDTLNNDNFKPHPALDALLEWFSTRWRDLGDPQRLPRAQTILRSWRAKHESPRSSSRWRSSSKTRGRHEGRAFTALDASRLLSSVGAPHR